MESTKNNTKESKKIIELKSTIELDNKTIVQLKTTIEENKKEIQSYEEKLKVMEEQLCISNTMKEEADTHIEKLNKENDKLEKNNEEINLLQQREANNIAQERIDNKKTIKVMERNIECLNNEKIELERKILKMRTEKGQKKMFNIEVQTECTREVFAIKNNEDINMNQRNMDIGKMQGYINTLKSEINKTAEKLATVNKKFQESNQKLKEKNEEIKLLNDTNNKLELENTELKNRREKAIKEIERLNQLLRRNFHIESGTQSNCRNKSKRCSSETVFI